MKCIPYGDTRNCDTICYVEDIFWVLKQASTLTIGFCCGYVILVSHVPGSTTRNKVRILLFILRCIISSSTYPDVGHNDVRHCIWVRTHCFIFVKLFVSLAKRSHFVLFYILLSWPNCQVKLTYFIWVQITFNCLECVRSSRGLVLVSSLEGLFRLVIKKIHGLGTW